MAESQIATGPGERTYERNIKRVFLMPAVLYLLLLSVFPLFWSLTISFTDYQRGGVGVAASETVSQDNQASGILGSGINLTLRNYARMFRDGRLHTAATNTLTFVLAGVTLQYVVGFLLALVLHQNFIGRSVVRIIFLMPMMVTPVAAAYMGRMLFDTRISPQAQLQRFVSRTSGLEISVPWLSDGFWATIAIILIDSWQWIPFMTLLLLAGMQGIPEDIYEAARVDGAGSFQILRKITFPILIPISITVILIRGLEIFKIIDVIVVTTGGGPGSATESLTMYIFDTALTFGNFGYAAAISFALLVMVVIFALLFLSVGRRAAAARSAS